MDDWFSSITNESVMLCVSDETDIFTISQATYKELTDNVVRVSTPSALKPAS